MKSGPIVVSLAGVVVICGIAYAFVRNTGASVDEPVHRATEAKTVEGTVQVDDLAEHPEKFQGEIVLRAAVAGVNKSEGVFEVIDSREFESCGVLTCAKNYLPVKFSGELPGPGTVVQITGEVVKGDKGLVFDAGRVDRVP